MELAVQGTFDELGTPLRDATFVVVDLETTGGAPADAQITEIGAVKVRAGEPLGEFQTLVNPGAAIPPFIQVLTGISDAMVATAPRIGAVVPAFLEFARGCVLVAHNAPFDVGFLKAACELTGHAWPGFDVIDTALLARRVVTRDEAPNCKLSSLARVFRAATTPNHRALSDARATVDVLHGLLERLGSLGVHSLEELATFSSRVSPAQRRKRHLAEGLPDAPGVYVFKDGQGRALYVGKSRSIRTRVRSYFTASETRSRMAEMVAIAEEIVPIVCATSLEAEVRELRLIAEHKPRYNRRSRFPERAVYLKLTVEPFPRLSVVRQVRADDTGYLGPFGSARMAEQAMTALHEAFPIRQCTLRLSPHKPVSPCALAEMGRCNAPCEGRESVEDYASHVRAARAAMERDVRPLAGALTERIGRLADRQRYEEAAVHRDRLAAFVKAAARMQRLAALSGCPQLVAARRAGDGGWELAVVRHGRLAAASRVPPGLPPRPYVDAAVATAETVLGGPGPAPSASAEESECVLRWLESPGTRLVEIDGQWTCPVGGAGALSAWLSAAAAGRDALASPDTRRGLRTLHRPAR
jgi:DNA polymerase-3 subunit epsilon